MSGFYAIHGCVAGSSKRQIFMSPTLASLSLRPRKKQLQRKKFDPLIVYKSYQL